MKYKLSGVGLALFILSTVATAKDYIELVEIGGDNIDAVYLRSGEVLDPNDDRTAVLVTQKRLLEVTGSAASSAPIQSVTGSAVSGTAADPVIDVSPNDHADDDVETVTGTAVDVTDPRNPVIDLVPAPIQTVTGTAVAGTATDPVIDISANDHVDDDVETVTGTAVNVTDPRNPVIDLVPAPIQTVTGTAVSGTASDPVIDHGSIDNATDVDTTSTAPAANDVIAWDGTNWVPSTLAGAEAIDFTGTTESVTHNGDGNYRNSATAAATWNLTPGSLGQFVINNFTNFDLTLNAGNGIRDPYAGNVNTALTSIVIPAREAWAFSQESGTAVTVISKARPAATGGAITTTDTTADANHTQDFAEFGQTWNDVGPLDINITAGTLDVNVTNSVLPGAEGDLNVGLGSVVATASNGSPTGVQGELRLDGNKAALSGDTNSVGGAIEVAIDNAGDPAILGEAQIHLTTNAVAKGNATAGQVLSLINETTGEVEFADAAGSHVVDSQALSGAVDTSVLMADLAESQAFHFYVLEGFTATLTHPTNMRAIVDGVVQLVAGNSIDIPEITRGILVKDATGVTAIYNNVDENQSDIFLRLHDQIVPAGTAPLPVEGFQETIPYVQLEDTDPVIIESYQIGSVIGENTTQFLKIRYFKETSTGTWSIRVLGTGIRGDVRISRVDTSYEYAANIGLTNTANIEVVDSWEDALTITHVIKYSNIPSVTSVQLFETIPADVGVLRIVEWEPDYHPDTTDTNRERWVVTEQNAQGQPGGDGIFPFEDDKLDQTHNSRLVQYNGDSTWTITTDIHPVQVILNAKTFSLTFPTERVSYIKETGAVDGTRLPNSTDGVFGNFVADVQATAIIQPNTTITVEGRSTSSGGSQFLGVGASMEFIELIEPTDQRSIIANAAGSVRVSRHEEVVNLTSTIVTGHDLTQAANMYLRVLIRDLTTDRGWQIVTMDVDNILETEATSNNDGFALLFDNDFINVDIVDAVTGEITFTQNGRDFEYVWSELWITAPTTEGMQEIANVALAGDATTAAFQPLGDPNELYTGADGDAVYIGFGDTTRDRYVFIDGIARSERRGSTTRLKELQVTAGGQVEIRHLETASTVLSAWYEWKDGVVRTTKSVASSDYTIETEDLGSVQDVRLDPVGVLHYLHNRRDIELTYAKEGTSGHGINVSKFDAATRTTTTVTYDNLENTTDSGGGVLAASGGVNSNFNRRAKTVESINMVGDYFEFTVNAFTNAFASARIAFAAASDSRNAEAINDEYSLNFATQGASYTLFDPSGATVASGTRGTFRVMRTYYGVAVFVDGVEVYKSPAVDIDHVVQSSLIDTIPEFNAGGAEKTDIQTLPNGQPYVVITDDAATTEVIERAYDGARYSFVEIEVVKDAAAVGGFYIRPNSTGGRQSQMRGSVVAPATFVANSGANTVLPTVIRELETEYTIRYLVQFNETAGNEHTDFEIAPAAVELDLTVGAGSPALTGSIGVVGVTLYGSNPL